MIAYKFATTECSLRELNELACEEDLLVCNPIKRDTTCTFKRLRYVQTY